MNFMRRMTNTKLEGVEKYNGNMTLEEFCEVSELTQFLGEFRKQGVSNVLDLLKYKKQLKTEIKMGVVYRGKFAHACRCLRQSMRRVQQKQQQVQPSSVMTQQQQQAEVDMTPVEVSVEPYVPPEGSGQRPPAHLPSDYEDIDGENEIRDYEDPVDPVDLVDPEWNDPESMYMNDEKEDKDYENDIVGDDQFQLADGENFPLYEDPDSNEVDATSLSSSNNPVVMEGQGNYEDPDEHCAEPPQVRPRSSSSRDSGNRTSILFNRPDTVQVVPDAFALPANPSDWDNSDVLRFLSDNDLDCFRDIVYQNGFDGNTMLHLKPAQFTKFSQEDRNKLGQALMKMRSQALSSRKGSSSSSLSIPPPLAPKNNRSRSSSSTSQNALPNTPTTTANKGDYNRLKPKEFVSIAKECGQKAVGLYEYNPTSSSNLGFSKGENIYILKATGEWWEAANEDGKQGLVPSNYLRLLNDVDETDTDAVDPIWFHTDVTSRLMGDKRLRKNGLTGTYLVRRGASNPNSMTLCVIDVTGTIVNLRISQDGLGKFKLLGTERTHDSLAALIEFYTHNELKVAGRNSMTLKSPCPKN
eukprot:m.221363 g.221363  ORF g.221363 m.221363 type:complete len:581 (-) comp13840_c1_seq20:2428-4170(-)